MRYLDDKALKTVTMLNGFIVKNSVVLDGFKIKYCDYKKDNIIPEIDDSWENLTKFIEFKELAVHFWIEEL